MQLDNKRFAMWACFVCTDTHTNAFLIFGENSGSLKPFRTGSTINSRKTRSRADKVFAQQNESAMLDDSTVVTVRYWQPARTAIRSRKSTEPNKKKKTKKFEFHKGNKKKEDGNSTTVWRAQFQMLHENF